MTLIKQYFFYKNFILIYLSTVTLLLYGSENNFDYNVYYSKSKTQLIVDGTSRGHDFLLIMHNYSSAFQGLNKGNILRFDSDSGTITLNDHSYSMHDYRLDFQYNKFVLNYLSTDKKKVIENHIASQCDTSTDAITLHAGMKNDGFLMVTIPVIHIPENMSVERIARVFLSTLKEFSIITQVDYPSTFLIKYSDNLEVIIPIIRFPITEEMNESYWATKAKLFSKMFRENIINLYY